MTSVLWVNPKHSPFLKIEVPEANDSTDEAYWMSLVEPIVPGDDDPGCDHRLGGLTCTRAGTHIGAHVATSSTQAYAAWLDS